MKIDDVSVIIDKKCHDCDKRLCAKCETFIIRGLIAKSIPRQIIKNRRSDMWDCPKCGVHLVTSAPHDKLSAFCHFCGQALTAPSEYWSWRVEKDKERAQGKWVLCSDGSPQAMFDTREEAEAELKKHNEREEEYMYKCHWYIEYNGVRMR